MLNGSFYCSKAFATRYATARERGGSIVSVIATYAWTGNAGTAHSAAAKAGVQNLMMTLAVEWAEFGIRCNSIAPGPILTPGATAHLFPTEEIQQAIASKIPAGRLGTLDDVVAATRFLLSDESSYVRARRSRWTAAAGCRGGCSRRRPVSVGARPNGCSAKPECRCSSPLAMPRLWLSRTCERRLGACSCRWI